MPLQSTVQHFSPYALALLSRQKLSAAHLSLHDKAPDRKQNKSLTVERVYKLINVLACIYACVRIAQCYHRYFIAEVPVSDSWYDQLITLTTLTMVKKARFVCASTIILGETLIGKSLAKLVVLCATGDVFDLIKK